MDVLDRRGIIDVDTLKLNPTWRNHRCEEEHIAKRLERFLVAEHLVTLINLLRQWVARGDDFYHNPILIELKRGTQKPPIPFKFNATWLNHSD